MSQQHDGAAVSSGELRLCAADALDEGDAMRVEIEGHTPFAVYRSEGAFFVSDDLCSHGDASLSEGTLEDGRIECPWHSGSFCLRTGAALTFPAVTPIRVYASIVRDGAIFIQIKESNQ